jgi:hypothetical protein
MTYLGGPGGFFKISVGFQNFAWARDSQKSKDSNPKKEFGTPRNMSGKVGIFKSCPMVLKLWI